LVGFQASWLTRWLVARCIGWLPGWLVGCQVDWLVARLPIGWLAGELFDYIYYFDAAYEKIIKSISSGTELNPVWDIAQLCTLPHPRILLPHIWSNQQVHKLQ